MDAREPSIEYKWVDVGVLDYDDSSKLYLVQKVSRHGRVVDDSGNTVVNGGILNDGMCSESDVRHLLPSWQYWERRAQAYNAGLGLCP